MWPTTTDKSQELGDPDGILIFGDAWHQEIGLEQAEPHEKFVQFQLRERKVHPLKYDKVESIDLCFPILRLKVALNHQ